MLQLQCNIRDVVRQIDEQNEGGIDAMELLHMLIHVIVHSLEDCVKMLPFLFLAFLILEAVEHYAQEKMEKALSGLRWGGPVVGALLGCVPQCGFSIIAAGLYSGGMITLGTLLSVFLATSDEAILILMVIRAQER